jgi:hypothetical protein
MDINAKVTSYNQKQNLYSLEIHALSLGFIIDKSFASVSFESDTPVISVQRSILIGNDGNLENKTYREIINAVKAFNNKKVINSTNKQCKNTLTA